MKPSTPEAIAETLLAGQRPDAQPWQIAAASEIIRQRVARGEREATEIRRAMRALNEMLLFAYTQPIGDAWMSVRGFDAEIAKRLAQALIELSALDAATSLLHRSLSEASTARASEEVERFEYEGLLGRVAKQQFVASGDRDALAIAIDQYYAQYTRPERPFWHGINAVALMARADREGLPNRAAESYEGLAREILTSVVRLYPRNKDPWAAATASEAALALDECELAELWLYRFLNNPGLTPFHVNSYSRNLQEIWQGSAVGAGSSCADRLTGIIAGHLARHEGRWSVSTKDVTRTARELRDASADLEKNFSGAGGFSVDTLRRMLSACASIGCVINATFERLGTGFLVQGSAISEAYGDGPVFVTNAHVISDEVPNAIPVQRARVTFELEGEAAGAQKPYEVAELLFTSPPGQLSVASDQTLDVTVVRLKDLPPGSRGLPLARNLPLVDPGARAYVVGHPRGSGLQISLHDSTLLDIDDTECLLHYRTPTDPGSSGSPVFNSQWETIAVHHSGSAKAPRLRGSGFYEANEGIALCAVRRELVR
jgi:V8-like Glu-specific endopeptidase